jgi:hypothetical protein
MFQMLDTNVTIYDKVTKNNDNRNKNQPPGPGKSQWLTLISHVCDFRVSHIR